MDKIIRHKHVHELFLFLSQFGRKQIYFFIENRWDTNHSWYLFTPWRSRFYFTLQIRHLVRFVFSIIGNISHLHVEWKIAIEREHIFSLSSFSFCNTIAYVMFESTSLFICYFQSYAIEWFDKMCQSILGLYTNGTSNVSDNFFYSFTLPCIFFTQSVILVIRQLNLDVEVSAIFYIFLSSFIVTSFMSFSVALCWFG